MIIITDCLTEKADEGCLKVANSLAKRLKSNVSETFLISYGRRSGHTDSYLNLNKLFLNKQLFDQIRNHKGNVLYIPFASNTLASVLRAWVLSIGCKKRTHVLFALRHPMSKLSRWLLKKGRFHIVALSKKSFDFYESMAPGRVLYLKTGVDTQKFCPVTAQEKESLKEKYQIDPAKPVVLHVGHLHSGRNVEVLERIEGDKQVLLVVSSVSMQDEELRKRLEARDNIRIIDQYLPDIQEIYQLSDVYLFPVLKEENCIDVPLSVLEAAACNIPIVTTAYGELRQFAGQPGVCFINSVDCHTVNKALNEMLAMPNQDNRVMVAPYDWQSSAQTLEDWMTSAL